MDTGTIERHPGGQDRTRPGPAAGLPAASVTRLLRWLRRFVGADAPSGWCDLQVQATGFAVDGRYAQWSDIAAIDAFEQELLGFDALWLRIETAAGTHLLSEVQPGFVELASALVARFPDVTGWEARVVGHRPAGGLVRLHPLG